MCISHAATSFLCASPLGREGDGRFLLPSVPFCLRTTCHGGNRPDWEPRPKPTQPSPLPDRHETHLPNAAVEVAAAVGSCWQLDAIAHATQVQRRAQVQALAFAR